MIAIPQSELHDWPDEMFERQCPCASCLTDLHDEEINGAERLPNELLVHAGGMAEELLDIAYMHVDSARSAAFRLLNDTVWERLDWEAISAMALVGTLSE